MKTDASEPGARCAEEAYDSCMQGAPSSSNAFHNQDYGLQPSAPLHLWFRTALGHKFSGAGEGDLEIDFFASNPTTMSELLGNKAE